MGAGGALLVVCLMLCASLGISGRTGGSTKQRAVCQLVLKGYGDKEGLKFGSLNCSTHDKSPLVVGIDRRYIGDKLQSQGVVLRDNWTECIPSIPLMSVGWRDAPEGMSPLVKSNAVLSFCGVHHLEFESISIKDLYRANYTQCDQLDWFVQNHNIETSQLNIYPCWVLKLRGVDGVISKGTFSGNGAGSVLGMTDTQLVVKNSRFEFNHAASGAAITAWLRNRLTLIGCEFVENVAYGMENLVDHGRGGRSRSGFDGIVTRTPERQESLDGLSYGCGEGGAISGYNSSVRIVNSTFERNWAEMGGALLLDFGASGSLMETTFVGNSAPLGGAIYASVGRYYSYETSSDRLSQLLLDSSVFRENAACTGLSLYVDSGEDSRSNEVRISKCTFNSSYNYPYPYNPTAFSPCANSSVKASIYSHYANLKVVDSIITDSWCSGIYCDIHWSSDGDGWSSDGDGGRSAGGCVITNSNISGNGRVNSLYGYGGEWAQTNCSAVDANSVVIDGNSLITNNTSLYGAGLHIRDYLFSGMVKLMMPSRISDNNATVAGGGLFCDSTNCIVEYDADYLQQSIYINTSPVAPDIFVPPHTMSLLKGSIDAAGHALNLTPDGAVPIKLQVKGAAGVAVANVSYRAIVASFDRGTVLPFINTTTSSGVVVFMLRLPLGRYNVSVSLNAVIGSSYLPYAEGQPDAISKSFELILGGCNIGQIVSDIDGVCQSCPRGSYSVHANATECIPCVDGASCPGGDLIVPNIGYWHSTRLATQLHECPNHDACQQSSSQRFYDVSRACRDLVIRSQAAGGLAMAHTACQQLQTFTTHMSNSTFSDLLCSTGYAGNMCGVCQRDNGYALVKPFFCKKCSQPGMIVSLFVVGWVLLLCMIKLLCYLTLRDAPAAISGATSSATFILKPFILYMQYMLIVGALIIQWPLPISAGFLALSVLFSSAAGETISIGCLLSSTPAWPVAIRRTLFYLSMPFVTLAALLLCECAWHAYRDVSRRTRTQHITLTDHLLSSAMVVLFFFLPSLARTTFSLFACLELDKYDAPDVAQDAMGSFWMFDMTQRCYHGYHRGWALGLGIPLAVLLCAGLPATILCVVFNKRSDNSTHHFGFLYRMYKPSHRYWEAVVSLQTLVLIAISVFGYNVGVYAQVVMMSFALAVILIMLVVVKPYAQQASHLVMCYGITCTLVTSYLALTMWTDNLFPGFAPGDKYRIAAASFVLLMNLVYIVFVVRELLRCLDWKAATSTAVAKAHGIWQRLSQMSRALSH